MVIPESEWLSSFSSSDFTFHRLERIFHAMERIFQPMECTFHAVEYKNQYAAHILDTAENRNLIICKHNITVFTLEQKTAKNCFRGCLSDFTKMISRLSDPKSRLTLH